ncbi:hypothetical protein R9C00_17010 [Flammeovirgaceae bacterium SG7u.111]|nr:hypothetical protein [Flammeovirgaceae bacterium SG7u.132]WPO33401.1 hypothetical protein R9C00_17010 [Flammeovirgaceae bacterium SG7u.111]
MNELDGFYLDVKAGRGGPDPRKRIERALRDNFDIDKHILFVGYKGCGKSTELNHLQKDIQDEFLVLNYSVMKELDPVHLNYIELFIVTMEQLFSFADSEDKIHISPEYLKNITHWLGTKEIKEINDKFIGLDTEAGAKGTIGVPYLKEFFYKFKFSAKSSKSLKETIKRNVEPKLSDLIEHCNNLIREIKLQLNNIGKNDLVIIIEDLDKIPIDRAQELFFNYTNQLVSLQTNVVFTFPISIYNSIKYNNIREYFSMVRELPMIKIAEKDGSDNEQGMDVMRKMVEKRMDTSTLIESSEILNQMIRDSGGCIRDLFRMIHEAGEIALDYDEEKITEKHRHQSYLALKKEYENTIADNTVDGKKYPVEGYYEVLVNLAKNTTKKVDNTEELLHLRDNLCVLGYNGEGWCDVHPIVKSILKERGKWDGNQEA